MENDHNNDFLLSLGVEGLTSRLKRLSDNLLYSTRDLYSSVGLDIEPNWNLLFRLLEIHGEMTVTEISEKIQFSHPAVIKIVNKMKQSGYLESRVDQEDKRKQLIRLTSEAKLKMLELESYWDKGTQVVAELIQNCPNFLEDLTEIEKQFNQKNYKNRVLDKLS